MMKRLLPFGLLLLAALACRSATSGTYLPPDANRMQADHAPTPFSAEEIRAACPAGRRSLYEMQSTGKAKVWQLSTFVVCDESGAMFEALALNEAGDQVGNTARSNATWRELQGHASFPAANTRIETATCRVPAGTFDCWLYVVTEEQEGRALVQRFWFARSLPGPPVRVVQEENGKVIFEMELVKSELTEVDER